MADYVLDPALGELIALGKNASRGAKRDVSANARKLRGSPRIRTQRQRYVSDTIDTRARFNERNEDGPPAARLGKIVFLAQESDFGATIKPLVPSAFMPYVRYIESQMTRVRGGEKNKKKKNGDREEEEEDGGDEDRDYDAGGDDDTGDLANELTFSFKLPSGRSKLASLIVPELPGTACDIYFSKYSYVLRAEMTAVVRDPLRPSTGRVTVGAISPVGVTMDPARYEKSVLGVSSKRSATERALFGLDMNGV
jgi:hypothetical protein